MPDNQYPVFEGGQTLTSAELNALRDFLHRRDRLLGRLAGFGVNCGLGGRRNGARLLVAPGLAVDQRGEPLMLAAEAEVPLPPVAEDESFEFVDPRPGGFSVVLEGTDVIEPDEACGESGCAGHAELHTTGVAVRVVAGRVTGTRMDFAAHPLLASEPMRLTKDSKRDPRFSYDDLRDDLVEHLTNGTDPLVEPRLIAQLGATTVASTEPGGVQAYKCGWINLVLFAALDLLRARTLMQTACVRTTERPGVVLGWLHLVGEDWVFDCAYRHAWEPPRGLTEAFLGGSCSDPLGRYRDELEAILAGYAPPDPAPTGDPKPPLECPRGSIRIRGRCVKIYYPPERIPDYWETHWEFDPREPVWYPPYDPTWQEPWKIYETPEWGFFGDGVIGGTDYVGQPAQDVKDVLETHIKGTGGIPAVEVLTQDKVDDLEGYQPAGGFSPSDTIVLTVQDGVVVATGRVAAVHNTSKVGTALPAAQAAAAEAKAAAEELSGVRGYVDDKVGSVTDGLVDLQESFGLLQSDFQDYKGGAFDQSGFGVRLQALEQQVVAFETLGSKISNLEGKVEILQKPLTGGTVVQKGIEADFGKGVAEFTETTLAAIKTLGETENPNFKRYAADAERAQAEFEVAVATHEPDVIKDATLSMLSKMRTAVKAAGVDPALGGQLDAQLRELRAHFR